VTDPAIYQPLFLTLCLADVAQTRSRRQNNSHRKNTSIDIFILVRYLRWQVRSVEKRSARREILNQQQAVKYNNTNDNP